MRFPRILRSQLLVAVTLCYITGILISCRAPSSVPLYIPALTAGALLFFALRRKETTALFLLLLLFLLTGLYAAGVARTPPSSAQHIVTRCGEHEEIVVLGTVKQLFSFNGEVSRFDLRCLSTRTAGTPFQRAQGTIRYTIKERLPHSIIPGTIVAVRASLKRPQRYNTPGSFDYPGYLANENIYVTGFISSPLHILPVHSEPTIRDTLRFFPEKLRQTINSSIDTSLGGEQAAIYKALLTGDRSAIAPATIELFKGTGTLHILAISGVHMSLLGVFLFAVFFWALRRSEWLILNINTKKAAALLCLFPLLFYTLIAGAKIPVVRSFIMSVVVLLAICFGKRHSFAAAISSAALLLLIISPLSLFSPSFQLTFAAVIAIAAAMPLIRSATKTTAGFPGRKWMAAPLSWVIAAAGVSLAATLGTAPLVIYHFNRISLVGIGANLVVEPLMCLWSLTLGFLATCSIFIFPPAAELLFNIGGLGITLAIAVVKIFHAIPGSSVYLPAPSLPHILLYYLSFACFLHFVRFPLKIRIALSLLPLCSLFFLAFPPAELTRKTIRETTLAFLDVGHGSCAFIGMPGGSRLLIDGGAISSPGFDIGERVIAPYLFRQGIGSIDDVIVTHPDSDHYNGLPFILRHFRVKRLWISTRDHDSAAWHEFLKTAADSDVEMRIAAADTILQQHGQASLTVLANTSRPGLSSSNDNGLVLKYRHGPLSVVFPGDISAGMEGRLVNKGIDLDADLLLATHHGSATSNSEPFIGSISPRYLVVSSGRHRSFSFPAQSVLQRCREQGIGVLPIKSLGTITVTTKKGEYRLNTLLSPAPRPEQ